MGVGAGTDVDADVGAARRRLGGGLRQAGRALLVVAAVVVSVLAVQATPVQAAPVRAAAAAQEWEWPLAGPPPVTRDFAPPAERYGRGHRGVDLGAAPGAVVRAAGAGQVSYAGLIAGRGVVVVVHGDLRTTYEPVTAEVAAGQQVVAGQALGRLAPGHEGCAAAACLHWGLRRGEQYLDPLSLVGAGPVRLLPLLDDGRGTSGSAPVGSERPALLGPAAGEVPPAVTSTGAPGFDLRSAATPSGALALAALLAGLVLLVGPRPPHRPAGAAAIPTPESAARAQPHVGAVAGDAVRRAEPAEDRPLARVLDLDHERARRAAPG